MEAQGFLLGLGCRGDNFKAMAICGIVVGDRGQEVAAQSVQVMAASLAMSAEDTPAQCSASQAGFGAVSSTGTTSVYCSNSLLVACDADIYNGRELAVRFGSPALPLSNATLIGLLYEQAGESFLNQLRGAFSIAIWDRRSATLLLARDRFGIKPLCYAADNSQLLFASQPRGIFASQRVGRRPAIRAIANYLNYNNVPAPDTAFEGVRKIMPGQCLLWRAGKVRTVQYWELQYTEDGGRAVEKLAAELLSRIEESVRTTSADLDMKRSGCFLSGGTDSSTVVGLFSRIRNHPANTFSIGFAEGRFDELEYARLAARHFRVPHTTAILNPANAYEVIPKIAEAYDEPYANSSAIPTYWCAKMAKENGIAVILAGDGGDELFGGNERYRTDKVFQLYHRVPRMLRRLLEPAVFAGPTRVPLFRKAQRYIRISNTPNPERYCPWRLLQAFPSEQVLGPAMPALNGDVLGVMRRHYQNAPAQSELNRLLYMDIKMTLGDDDLPKVVRMTELAGISVRFPYLDHPLAEFSGTLPASLKVRGLKKRYLFKRATRSLLPEAILNKKKHGFGLPIGMWLKTDPRLRAMSRDILLDPRTYQRGYFQRQFIEYLFVEMEQDQTPYFGDLLWTFLMLELWHRRHVEGAAL
jgi:asparagine synthase (glutamine-hydrolysing)